MPSTSPDAPLLIAKLKPVPTRRNPDRVRSFIEWQTPKWASQALAAMGSRAQPDLVAFLAPVLRAAPQPGGWDIPAYHATWALARVADARALPVLRAALTYPDGCIRSTAVAGLGHVGGAEAIRLLIGALSDQDAHVRAEACSALGRIAGVEALPALRRLAAKEPKEWTKAGWRSSPAVTAIAQINARLGAKPGRLR
jgi:hypothetical protein